MKFKKQVVFHPWVGKNYGKNLTRLVPGANTRLLVLGESHYGNYEKYDAKDLADETTGVVKRFVFGDKSIPFFTSIGQAIAGEKRSKLGEDRFQKLWKDIAFYNFVQSSKIPEARIRPTKEMFENSFGAFKEVVEKLEPTHIWVCGKALWMGLPYCGYKRCPDVEMAGEEIENGTYQFGNTRTWAFATCHPSSGRLKSEVARNVITYFLGHKPPKRM